MDFDERARTIGYHVNFGVPSSPGHADGPEAPFFRGRCGVLVDLHARGVHGEDPDLHGDDPLLDRELTELTRMLAKAGIPYGQSGRYRKLNRRIRAYVTNETNRILNKMADRDIRELVVEDLDFRHGGLSKRMNRIIGRAGRNAVKRKLQDLEDTKGVIVTKVNPAYTSRECSRCGHVDKHNRPNRDLFRCICCGTRLPADINASRTILARRSRGQDWRRIGREQILLMLRTEHGKRCRPFSGGHAVSSAATSRIAKTTPGVKVNDDRKYHH